MLFPIAVLLPPERFYRQAADTPVVELDFINPARARSLDEDWGINHTTLFFEILGSTAKSQ